MADQSFEFDVLADLLDEAATVGVLAGDEKTFAAAYQAFRRRTGRPSTRSSSG